MKYLIVSLLLFSNLYALTIKTDVIDFEKFPLEVYADKNNSYTFETIHNAAFEPSLSKKTFGYKKDQTFWIRTQITNQSTKDHILYVYHKDAYTYLDVIFYEFQKGVLLKTLPLGRNVPMQNKPVKDSSPIYLLDLKKGETKTLYIKNQSKSTMLVNLQVLDIEHYHKANLLKNGYYLFFFGAVIALVFYNVMLFLSIRAVEYLYYVIFIAGSICYLLYVSGIPLEFFGADSNTFTSFLYGIPILQIALILFSQKVIETQKYLPKLHQYLNVLIYGNTVLLVLSLMSSINNFLSIFSPFALVVAFSLLYVGYAAVRVKIHTGVYFLASIGAYLLFALIGILMYVSILPYTNFTRYALFLASLSEVFLLSLLLSYRISLLRYRATSSEKKLHYEIIKRNKILEKQVDERTEELQTLNSSLEDRVTKSLVTLRKKDEDLLRQSRMAMLGEMLSMIAHQWRQPLSSIASVRSNMELELHLDEDVKKENLLQQLGNMDKYIQFMSKTIEDFRSFFKPERTKNHIHLEDVIHDAVNMLAPSLAKNEIDIDLDLIITPKIATFRNELIQVLLNLIKNAQDAFTEKAITSQKIKIILQKDDDFLTLTVEDNAGGIPDAIIGKIFDPYFSTKEEKNGTGLGLYMSKIIIEEHCLGKISVSNTGQGASFVIQFKLNENHENLL